MIVTSHVTQGLSPDSQTESHRVFQKAVFAVFHLKLSSPALVLRQILHSLGVLSRVCLVEAVYDSFEIWEAPS